MNTTSVQSPPSTTTFGDRLVEHVTQRGPLCVGIDPHPAAIAAWGLDVNVAGLERVARTLIEAVAGQVAVVKPQSAFYETFGSAGVAVLERVLADAHQLGALTLLDVKRGDIGSTMQAYAEAYLGDGSPLAADAITVSPYLGMHALDPAFDLAAATGRGVFVLALTSNADGAQVQRARVAGSDDGRTVAQTIVDEVAARNAAARTAAARTAAAGTAAAGTAAAGTAGRDGGSVARLGSYGLVVGATHAQIDLDLGQLDGPVLVPGLGAQGGTPELISAAFGSGPFVLPSSSREIMAAGPDVTAIRARTVEVGAAVAAALSPR